MPDQIGLHEHYFSDWFTDNSSVHSIETLTKPTFLLAFVLAMFSPKALSSTTRTIRTEFAITQKAVVDSVIELIRIRDVFYCHTPLFDVNHVIIPRLVFVGSNVPSIVRRPKSSP